ncbi:MAG: fumarylacetoacetate hydrolase family protein [Salinivirgaceae bacterium]|nr:fumarylacetoacetate hydrolase family protein [Salinivirgaceae bacterium]MBR4620295.1 fumarylacetoacetate hydrolase family protein [Salinivirgaceae bacterium]MBR6083228.1 fumarylacetoacetate hydrolase family protein [Salinivirgaceae bacterium]
MKILGIGMNYRKHAAELGMAVPTEPVVFLMPETALITRNLPFFYPDFSNEIHHEVELVLKINRLGKNIPEKFANRYYDEIGIGIDFTARDLQRKAVAAGHPWTISKGFDGAAPIGNFVSKTELGDLNNISFSLEKNGQLVQQGNSADMIFSFDALIAYASKFFTLKIGDLIFTGTPVGVGPVQIGDNLVAKIGDRELLNFNVK